MAQVKEQIDSNTFIEYVNGRASLISGRGSVSITEENGAFINGTLSVSAKPTNIRIGGIYTFHPLTLTGIPSSNITPIPTFRINMPVKGLSTVTSIVSNLKAI